MAFDPAALTQRQRAMWAAGDYPDIARTIEAVSHEVVAAVGVREGETLLDVATGSGNAALEAARRGARVTGLDLTPELLETAKERAAAAQADIELVHGDAQALPFADDSFERVTSVFGAMFAPDQPRAYQRPVHWPRIVLRSSAPALRSAAANSLSPRRSASSASFG